MHLLIPATTSNKDLCRLLLSAAVLNYPIPSLINWGAVEDSNPFVQHLAKISKTLNHLRGFPSSDDDDLVLIVDGYDVWFQLRSDVLIRRYFAVKRAADERVASELGPDVARKHDTRHTVIFGPDKLCWPSGEGKRPACWAVPQSPLPPNSFGPFDDTEIVLAARNASQTRPRWLNSGTIMGTIADIRAVFEATLASINANHTTDSDQFYLANLFGEQEYSRRLLKREPDLPPAGTVDLPSIVPGKKTEFHMGLDYESTLFQSAGYYISWISWLWFNGSVGTGRSLEGRPLTKPHGFVLPEDIAASSPPFSAESGGQWMNSGEGDRHEVKNITQRLPINLSWRDLPLATNTVTKQVFALIHFTFEKKQRDAWWDKMWFYPYGRELLESSVRVPQAPVVYAPVDGRIWWNAARSPANSAEFRKSTKGTRGGAWSDTGYWLAWDAMCNRYDDAVFGHKPG